MARRGGECEHPAIVGFRSAEQVADRESGQRKTAEAENRAIRRQ